MKTSDTPSLDPEELALEKELSDLSPLTPTDRLRRELEWEAKKGAARRTIISFPSLRGGMTSWMASAAALVVLLVSVGLWWGEYTGNRSSLGAAVAQETVVPESSSRTLSSLDENAFLVRGYSDDVVEFDDGLPMRRVRYEVWDPADWERAGEGQSLESGPEERVFFLPVRYD